MLIANVLKKLIRESLLLAPDLASFKRQESLFIVLNLFVLAILLLIQTLFSSFFGPPPLLSVVVLAAGFLINVVALIWLQSVNSLSAAGIVVLTWCSVALNMLLAFTMASLSYRQDTQYLCDCRNSCVDAGGPSSLQAGGSGTRKGAIADGRKARGRGTLLERDRA
ncbi:MAG: hypothetical protein LAO79_23250 [Acidobacteriia bacterium]|nr:hypothetical protein [Terriglobia bacterium]